MEQRNYCGDCGCECRCNGDCGGDTKKCTSKKALKKGCTHHCECYVAPMVAKWEKEGLLLDPIKTSKKE